MKKLIVFALLVATFPFLTAVNVTGRVIDSETRLPIEFVTVTVYNHITKKNAGGALTNQDGLYTISSVAEGAYELRVNFVGYDSLSVKFNAKGTEVALGDAMLAENVRMLNEVQVMGQGSQMRFDIDKKIFSVDQNIAATGGSATDVLQNIPSVDVDNDGNVSLRNNSSVEIWINGKPSGLTADNRAQVLQQMPAENLETIEVITNPSAKFNPEGTAGIINLVMKKNRKAGYYGSVSAGSIFQNQKPGFNLGTNINYNIGKFDIFANIGYRQMNNTGQGYTERTNFNNGDSTLLIQNSTNKFNMGGLFFRAGVDYRLNDKNTIGISGFGHSGNPGTSTVTDNSLTHIASGNLMRDYSRTNNVSSSYNGYNINLYHKIDLDEKGSNLLTNIIHSKHGNYGDQHYTQDDRLLINNKQDISQISDGDSKDIEVKTDFTWKISDKDRLELGWSSRWNNRMSESTGYDNLNQHEIDTYYNLFDYNEQIHAAYTTFGTRINNFSAQAGLRAEYFNSESSTTPADTRQPIQNSYFQLFPSIYLSYSMPKNNELQLNYTRRINRPRGRQINSFRDYADSTNITYGNPGLTPEFASAMELNYLKNWDNHTLSSSLYYRFTNNVIERVGFIREDVMESTYMNLTKRRDIGLELVAKNRLFRIVNLTSSLNIYQSNIDSATYIHPLDSRIKVGISPQQSLSWNARVIANVMFMPTLSGQVTGQYRSSELLAQGERLAMYSMDLGIRKTFFDRKLSVNLNVRDLLNSRSFKGYTWGEGFRQYSDNKRRSRTFGITVTYNFGNMQPQKPQHPISSEDMNGDESEMGIE